MNNKINKNIVFQDLGIIDYQEAWEYQEKLLKINLDIKLKNRELSPENTQKTNNNFIFVEHPHVYTLGKSGKEENMLINDEKLQQLGASFLRTNRGGDITYHGYGQVVGYPIIDLENFYTDIHRYMRDLEEVIILTIAEYGINGERSSGETGVWLDVGKPYARKICAMGVKASRWITLHGFALNVNTDLSYFEHIIPCGIRNKRVTSLKDELKREISMNDIKNRIKHHFLDVFNGRYIKYT